MQIVKSKTSTKNPSYRSHDIYETWTIFAFWSMSLRNRFITPRSTRPERNCKSDSESNSNAHWFPTFWQPINTRPRLAPVTGWNLDSVGHFDASLSAVTSKVFKNVRFSRNLRILLYIYIKEFIALSYQSFVAILSLASPPFYHFYYGLLLSLNRLCRQLPRSSCSYLSFL